MEQLRRSWAVGAHFGLTPRDYVAWISERVAYAYRPLLLGEADVFRSSEFEHAVQHVDCNGNFGRATPVRARAQPVPNHALEPNDVGLDQRTPVIACRLMTPSGDRPDATAQDQSFSLDNIVPRTPELNRGIWEGVESAVCHLAGREGELFLVTGPAFAGEQLKSIGPDGVLVPSSTWKAVYDPRVGGAGAYVCTNTVTPTCQTISVAVLIQTVGIDPFPALSARVKGTAMVLPEPEDSPFAPGHHHRRRHKMQDLLEELSKL